MAAKRKNTLQLTRLELEIMQVLWEVGPATVQVVRERLAGEPLAYTTVQTMLNVLHRKGRVKRKLAGKAFEYRAVLTHENAVRSAVGDLVDRLFGGSPEALVMSLVKTGQLDPKKRAELKKAVEEHDRMEKGAKRGDD
jgi:BlaI family transcriptional regulator, penicillinase repressor